MGKKNTQYYICTICSNIFREDGIVVSHYADNKHASFYEYINRIYEMNSICLCEKESFNAIFDSSLPIIPSTCKKVGKIAGILFDDNIE